MRSAIKQVKNRVLQLVAFHVPGAKTLRVRLHQWRGVKIADALNQVRQARDRGVKIGQNVWIGYQVLLETSRPHLITIGDNVIISIRAMMIAHFRGPQGIRIEDDAFIGSRSMVVEGARVRRGAKLGAGTSFQDIIVATASAPLRKEATPANGPCSANRRRA